MSSLLLLVSMPEVLSKNACLVASPVKDKNQQAVCEAQDQGSNCQRQVYLEKSHSELSAKQTGKESRADKTKRCYSERSHQREPREGTALIVFVPALLACEDITTYGETANSNQQHN
jgi:hypothetical protein